MLIFTETHTEMAAAFNLQKQLLSDSKREWGRWREGGWNLSSVASALVVVFVVLEITRLCVQTVSASSEREKLSQEPPVFEWKKKCSNVHTATDPLVTVSSIHSIVFSAGFHEAFFTADISTC